jgi:hypothetical protein
MSRLLQILRGRLVTAEYGPGGNINAPPIRDDLGDLSRRIANLGERQRASVQRYGQESRTLAGLALARLVSFPTSSPSRLQSRPMKMSSPFSTAHSANGSSRKHLHEDWRTGSDSTTSSVA